MAKQQRQEEVAASPKADDPKPETEVVRTDSENLKALFARSTNQLHPVRSLKLKRTLTKPLIAAAHFKQLLFQCEGEMYEMTLPAKGRGAAPSVARVVDGIDVETGEEAVLMCNQMMVGAWKRAGFTILDRVVDKDDNETFVHTDGAALKGHVFAFKSGNINEDGGYRHVDVVEVEIER